MADETTATTEAQPAEAQPAAAATTAAAHPVAGATGDKRPEPLPKLDIGSTETDWTMYLQQMLNYHYQSQVVMETGDYDSQTGGAVDHFRSQQGLGSGTATDSDVWEKLGVQDPAKAWDQAHPQGAGGQHGQGQHGQGQHGQGQHGQQHGEHGQQHGQHGGDQQHEQAYEPVYHQVQMIQPTHDGSCWAAAMAMVLNLKGNSYTVESLCERAHIQASDYKGAAEVRSAGTELGLQPVACNGTTPAGWAQALHYGPVWAPNPSNDYNVLVIAGVSGTGAEAIIHVLNPTMGSDEWMNFTQFTQQYPFGDNQELLV